MTAFSPWTALAGGALIGAAAVLLMTTKSRVMGISGILGGLTGEPRSKETPWRLSFVAGMATPAAVLAALGQFQVQGSGSTLGPLLLAGFLVGFGSRMANGCTSGHGICGLARLSPHSLTAVAVFMAAAGAVVFIRRHLIGD